MSLADGASYLWWLNGCNRGSQVKPDVVREVAVDGVRCQVIAWDMTQSGIADNLSTMGATDITRGQTIFGLTSTTGQSVIRNITFAENVDYVLAAIDAVRISGDRDGAICTVDGKRVSRPVRGINIVHGRKFLEN